MKASELPLPGAGQFDTFHGTGFWISSDLVLSCWHNYRDTIGKDRWSESIIDHTGHVYKDVEVIAKNPGADLMIVRVKNVRQKSHGQLIISTDEDGWGPYTAIGLEGKSGLKVKWVSGDNLFQQPDKPLVTGPDDKHVWFYIVNCPIEQGMSGGPVFDLSNEVVGISIRSNIDRKNVEDSYTFIVNLPTIQEFLDTVDVED